MRLNNGAQNPASLGVVLWTVHVPEAQTERVSNGDARLGELRRYRHLLLLVSLLVFLAESSCQV